MFEKEAEEYTLNKLVGLEDFDNYQSAYDRYENGVQDAFKDGAKFGYNKAKEDADKMKSRFLELCNLKDMRIKELEKANEWHYVKDGKYPKESCIVYYKDSLGVPSWSVVHPSWHIAGVEAFFKNNPQTIAWKEIVLPKEIKEK